MPKLYRVAHRGSPVAIWVWALLTLPMVAVQASDSAESRPSPAVAIDSIQVVPNSLTLDGRRDSRRVLVTGQAADGSRVELSAEATYAPSGDGLAFDKDDNALTVYWQGGKRELSLSSKAALARQLIALIAERYRSAAPSRSHAHAISAAHAR